MLMQVLVMFYRFANRGGSTSVGAVVRGRMTAGAGPRSVKACKHHAGCSCSRLAKVASARTMKTAAGSRSIKACRLHGHARCSCPRHARATFARNMKTAAFRSHVENEIQGIKDAGTYKVERVITSPQDSFINVSVSPKVPQPPYLPIPSPRHVPPHFRHFDTFRRRPITSAMITITKYHDHNHQIPNVCLLGITDCSLC